MISESTSVTVICNFTGHLPLDDRPRKSSEIDGIDSSVAQNSESDSSCQPAEIAVLSTAVFPMNDFLFPRKRMFQCSVFHFRHDIYDFQFFLFVDLNWCTVFVHYYGGLLFD